MSDVTANVQDVLTRTMSMAGPLQDAGIDHRAFFLADAAARLAQDGPLLSSARAALETSSGLSAPMIAWALSSTLSTFDVDALRRLARNAMPPRPGAFAARSGNLAVVVLSGNVFTACLKAVAVPLLLGFPVIAKASSRDDALPRALALALKEADRELSRAYEVVTFDRDDETQARALFAQADVVSAFGADASIVGIRALLPARVALIAHGHGLGAAWINAAALRNESEADELARRLALDVAAYDQRGCLSPQTVWIQNGGQVTPARFAELLRARLEELSRDLPRGPGALSTQSAELQWRGVSATLGELLEGPDFAIALEQGDSAPRPSPGMRNVQLIALDDESLVLERLKAFGVHLKCLAIANMSDASKLAVALPSPLAPRICSLGRMQTPSLDSLSDGLAPWEGFQRWIDLD
jgi:hypothetical protein